jgi:hypothetical protein
MIGFVPNVNCLYYCTVQTKPSVYSYLMADPLGFVAITGLL